MNELLKTTNTSLNYNQTTKSLILELKGIVSMEELKEEIEALQNIAPRISSYSIIMNCSKLIEITAEARVWYQDEFTKKDGSCFLNNANSFAIVLPSDSMAKFMIRSFNDLCYQAHPTLNHKEFTNLKKASSWTDPSTKIKSTSSFSSLWRPRLGLRVA